MDWNNQKLLVHFRHKKTSVKKVVVL